jgi:hypothetical protein
LAGGRHFAAIGVNEQLNKLCQPRTSVRGSGFSNPRKRSATSIQGFSPGGGGVRFYPQRSRRARKQLRSVAQARSDGMVPNVDVVVVAKFGKFRRLFGTHFAIDGFSRRSQTAGTRQLWSANFGGEFPSQIQPLNQPPGRGQQPLRMLGSPGLS